MEILEGNKVVAPLIRLVTVRHMNFLRVMMRFGACGKTALAGLLVLLLTFSALAAAGSSLHGWIHPDSHAASHWCLVTSIEQGQSEVASVPVSAPLPAVRLVPAAPPVDCCLLSRAVLRHPVRGPPILS